MKQTHHNEVGLHTKQAASPSAWTLNFQHQQYERYCGPETQAELFY